MAETMEHIENTEDVLKKLIEAKDEMDSWQKYINYLTATYISKVHYTYFWHSEKHAYCQFNPKTTADFREGYLGYKEFYIGTNEIGFPSIFARDNSWRFNRIPVDEIKIITKEEFVVGLKEQLQDALDKM